MKYQTAKYFLVFFAKRKKNVLDVCRMIFEEHGSVILWTVCGRRSFCVNRIDKVDDRLSVDNRIELCNEDFFGFALRDDFISKTGVREGFLHTIKFRNLCHIIPNVRKVLLGSHYVYVF